VTRILSFGDSMTAGTTSPPRFTLSLDAGLRQSYPFKLQELATARYTAQTITLLNAGRAGEHVVAPETLARFDAAVSEARPDLILLLEGANDLNDVPEAVNAAIAEIVGWLEEMVKNAGRRGIPIMIGTLPPQRLPGGKGAPYLARFNDAVKVMAGKKGAILVDVNAQLPEALIGQDGLHPTEAGYQRLAEIYLDAIKGMYETAPAAASR
jgi:lysophospholipase L1-like esterase